jgi:hypothetical protein
MTRKQSVYVTVPNGNGWLHKLVHFAIIKILSDGRYSIRHDCPTHSPYVNNLHHCMNDFLNSGENYWLSMDTDNPPTNNPLDLVEMDLDLIGFPTPVWHNSVPGDRPWYFNALDVKGDGYIPHEPCKGLQEVDAIGSGCFLVSRRVILELKDQQPFMRTWNRNGTVEVGGDYSFCRKVKAAGFHIWTHYDYICHHFNEVSLLEVIGAFNGVNYNG